MLKHIVLPEIADNVVSGLVGEVLVAVGDIVQVDDPVAEVETEKATSQIPTEVAGKVVEVKVAAGDTVKVGATLVVIEAVGEQAQVVAEVAEREMVSAKAAVSVPEVKQEIVPTVRAQPKVDTTVPAGDRSILVPAAPSVRKFAREMGVNIADVSGTGPGARITVEDVKEHIKYLLNTISTPNATGVATAPQGAPLPDFSKWGEVHVESFNKIREVTAKSMTTSWQTIPQVTQFDKADITA